MYGPAAVSEASVKVSKILTTRLTCFPGQGVAESPGALPFLRDMPVRMMEA